MSDPRVTVLLSVEIGVTHVKMPLEYTCEMQQVDEGHRAGTPVAWVWPPRRVDRRGISDPPSRRVLRAQSLVRFLPGAYRLHA